MWPCPLSSTLFPYTTLFRSTWFYQVSNNGQVAIDGSSIAVIDNQAGAVTNLISKVGGNQNSSLDAGTTWTYTKDMMAQAGAYTNIGTVTANTVADACANVLP